MIVTLATLVYGIIEGPGSGWTSPVIIGCFVRRGRRAVTLVAAYEPRAPEPLLDLRFFRSAPFSGATLIAVCAFAGLGGFLFLNTLYLQDVRGLRRCTPACYMLPMAAMTVSSRRCPAGSSAPRGPGSR